ncbi:MAG: hypothetical protein R6U98_08050, partial [Pirellulaceae bacterium]
ALQGDPSEISRNPAAEKTGSPDPHQFNDDHLQCAAFLAAKALFQGVQPKREPPRISVYCP